MSVNLSPLGCNNMKKLILLLLLSYNANSAPIIGGGGAVVQFLDTNKVVISTVNMITTNTSLGASNIITAISSSVSLATVLTNTTILTNIPTTGFLVPSSFGAVGDGSADDTAALQLWINASAQSNFVALLPPAIGAGYYKITAPLYVTNINGVRILGNGGGTFHNPGNTPSKVQIRQFTAGMPALVITNSAGSSQPPDSVHITSVAFVNNAYSSSTNSYGIGFVGGVADSDNCSINYCLVSGFRYGIVNAGAAILTVQGSVMCYNGDGYYQGPYQENQSPVLNANYMQGCSLTHNYSNSISSWSGRLTVESCDLIGNSAAGIGQELLMTNSTVSLRNVNLEHQSSTLPAYVVLQGSRLTVQGGLHQSFAASGPNTYLVVITNMPSASDPGGTNATSTVEWSASGYSMAATNSISFIEINTNCYTYFRFSPAVRYLTVFNASGFAGGFRIYTNYSENFDAPHFPSISGEALARTGQTQINRESTPGAENTYLSFGAQIAGVQTNVDLTRWYKESITTMTNKNLVITGTLVGDGSGLTNVGAAAATTSIFPNTNEFMIYPRDVWIYGPSYGPATNSWNVLRDTSMPGGNFGSDLWRLWQTGGGDGVTYNVPLWCTQVVGTVWFQWYGGTGTSYITNRIRAGQSLTNTWQWPTLTDYGFQLQPSGVTNYTFTANFNPWANSTIGKTLQWHMQAGSMPTNATGNLYWLKAKLWLKGNPQILDN